MKSLEFLHISDGYSGVDPDPLLWVDHVILSVWKISFPPMLNPSSLATSFPLRRATKLLSTLSPWPMSSLSRPTANSWQWNQVLVRPVIPIVPSLTPSIVRMSFFLCLVVGLGQTLAWPIFQRLSLIGLLGPIARPL